MARHDENLCVFPLDRLWENSKEEFPLEVGLCLEVVHHAEVDCRFGLARYFCADLVSLVLE